MEMKRSATETGSKLIEVQDMLDQSERQKADLSQSQAEISSSLNEFQAENDVLHSQLDQSQAKVVELNDLLNQSESRNEKMKDSLSQSQVQEEENLTSMQQVII